MTVGERMRERRKQLGLSAEYIAERLGCSPATIYRYENGYIEKMPIDSVIPIANILGVTPAYLMGWEDAFGSETPPANIIPMPTMHKVPLIGSIACGTPILAEENREGAVDVPDHIHADFALRCKGDSMINARIFDGDVVYIRQQENVEHGEIAAVLVGDEATLKRVYAYDDCLSLEAENPLYKPMVFRGEEMNRVRILGKAVAFTSLIR